MTNVKKEALRFETPDHFSIAGDLYFEASSRRLRQACVILIHQFHQNKEQWGPLPSELVDAGFKVLAYDMRGHGASDKVKDMTALLSDPQETPFDFDGAVQWLNKQQDLEADVVAAVGTSVGAHIACEANAAYRDRVKAAVAISPSLKGVLDFLRHKPAIGRMCSTLYVAAKGDGTFARDAEELASKYTDSPKKVVVFADSSDHGVALLNSKPEIRKLIVNWLHENLNS